MVTLIATLVGVLGGMGVARELVAGLPCYGPESVCGGAGVTFACLAAIGGGLGAGAGAAATDETDPRGWFPGTVNTDAARQSYDRPYAPDPAPGRQAPQRQSPQDALNDPEFQRQRDDYAFQHRDTSPIPPPPSFGERAADTLVESLRHAGSR